MKVEKEVTIYVESFIDALEIVDKMDESLPHSVIFMDEDEFDNCKCYIVINKIMFMFYPVYKLFKEKEGDNENTSDKVVDSSRIDDLDT